MFYFDYYYWVNLSYELAAARNRDVAGDRAVAWAPRRSHTNWLGSFVLARVKKVRSHHSQTETLPISANDPKLVSKRP